MSATNRIPTYYIHPDPLYGNDANAGTSELLPIQNWTKTGFMAALVANDFAAQAGGSIWNAGPTNRIVCTISGTASAPIRMGSYGIGKAVIDGAGTRDIAIFGTNVQWIEVDNFEIRNYTRAGPYWGTSTDSTIDRNIKMSNLHIHNIRGNTSATGVQTWGQHVTLEDSLIEIIESDGWWSDGDFIHINRCHIRLCSYFGGGLGDCMQTTVRCHGILIENSTFDHRNNSDKQIMLIDGTCTSGIVRFNKFYGIDSVGAGGITVVTANGIHFICNRVEAYDGIYFLTPSSTGFVIGNVFIGNGTGHAIASNTAAHTIQAFNNTCYNWYKAIEFTTQGTAKNNISHTTTYAAINAGTKAYNCIFNDANIGALSYDGTHITTDPKLNADYSIPSTSPCKGAGTFIGFYHDYYGKELNMPPDIGAVNFMDTVQSEQTRLLDTQRRVVP